MLIFLEILVISLVRAPDNSCNLYSYFGSYSFICVLLHLQSVELGYSIVFAVSCFSAVCLKQIPAAVLSVGRDLAKATSPVSVFFPCCAVGLFVF